MVDLFNLDAKCAAAELAAIKAQKELDAFIERAKDEYDPNFDLNKYNPALTQERFEEVKKTLEEIRARLASVYDRLCEEHDEIVKLRELYHAFLMGRN